MSSCAALLVLVGTLQTAPPDLIVVDDFEDVGDWSGLDLDTGAKVEGAASGRWDNHTAQGSIGKTFTTPIDASGTDALSVWIHSEVANGARVELVFDSENPGSEGWDYYRYPIVVDWTGWRHLWLLRSQFNVARNPLGWNTITEVSLHADGWSHQALADTVLRLDDMRFVVGVIDGVTSAGAYESSGYAYRHDVALSWPGSTALSVDIAAELQSGSYWQATVTPPRVDLAAGGSATVQIDVRISSADMLPDRWLDAESVRVVVLEAARERDTVTLEVAVPLPAREAPRLLVDSAGFDRALERSATLTWAASAVDDILARADDWPTAHLERFGLPSWTVPPEGGQWGQWYVCPVHGVSLTFTAPDEHACPIDQQLWSGWPFDQVILSRRHSASGQAARDLGLAFQLTGNVAYAEKAADILLAYADVYGGYPIHNVDNAVSTSGARVMSQTLDESVWLIPVAWAYDLIAQSGALTTMEKRHIEVDLLRPAVDVIRRNDAGMSNWQSWHNAAIGAVGFTLEDPRMTSEALHGPSGFAYQMANSVTADGFWYEGSWGYHFYALDPLTKTALMAERAGIDLFSHPSLRRMFSAPVSFAMPDLSLPAFNDSGVVKLPSQVDTYEIASARDADPSLRRPLANARRGEAALWWGLTDLNTTALPALGSIVFPDSGYVVLRAGSGENAHYVALDFGPHGGWHGHFDKLGFVSFARGVVMGVDPGTQSYAVATHTTWDKVSVAHNTLIVDELVQAEATGALTRSALLPDVGFARTEAGDVHPGVAKITRQMALVPDYVLDVVTAEALDNQAHQFDLVYHNNGVASTAVPLNTYSGFPSTSGYQHLSSETAASVDGDVAVRFDLEGLAESAYGSVWASATGVSGSYTMSRAQAATGTGSGRVHYDFSGAAGYVLYTASITAPVAEAPSALIVQVHGDGSGHSLRLRLMDATSERFVFNAGNVTWTGWREIRADNPAGWTHYQGDDDGIIDTPVRSVVLDVGRAGSALTGDLYVDDIVLEYNQAGRVVIEDFEWADRALTWAVLGSPGSTLVVGEGLGPDLRKPVPFAMVRRHATATEFIGLLEPHGLNRQVANFVALTTQSGAGEAVQAFELEGDGWMDWWMIVGAGEATTRVAGDGACDGVLCYVRMSSARLPTVVALAGGHTVADTDRTLVAVMMDVDWVRVDVAGDTLTVQSSPAVSGLRVLAPAVTRVVEIGGTELEWNRDGEYVVVRPGELADAGIPVVDGGSLDAASSDSGSDGGAQSMLDASAGDGARSDAATGSDASTTTEDAGGADAGATVTTDAGRPSGDASTSQAADGGGAPVERDCGCTVSSAGGGEAAVMLVVLVGLMLNRRARRR